MPDEFRPAGIEKDKIILDFKHSGDGKNCQTSALVRLMHHLGYEISEAMLIGISAGMGFIYWFMKQMTYPFIGGMNRQGCREFPGILGKAVRRLGGDFEYQKTKSVKKAHEFLKDTLRQNQPALVCVDMAYLDHLLTGEDDHFGEHNFLVYGIDEPENLAYISDRFPGTATMALTQLQRARASEYAPFPAKNQMVRFSFPKKLTPLTEIIPSAIKENIDALLHPPISNAGLPGFIKWSKELKKYPVLIPNPRDLVHALMMHYVFIETGGSGGAIFRQMYTDFLKQAASLLKSKAIKKAADKYEAIVLKWHEIADGLLPEECPSLKKLREIQRSINEDLETKGLSMLSKISARAGSVSGLIDKAATSEIKDFPEFIEPVRDKLIEVSEMERQALEELEKTL